MRNVFALAVCVFMAVSFTACAGKVDSERTSDTTHMQSSENIDSSDTETLDTDNSLIIPLPPFAYTQNSSDVMIDIRSTNGGKDGDVTHKMILDYCEQLKGAGFTENLVENEIGERYGRTCYEFSASDSNGNSVNLIDDGGGVVIIVSIAK